MATPLRSGSSGGRGRGGALDSAQPTARPGSSSFIPLPSLPAFMPAPLPPARMPRPPKTTMFAPDSRSNSSTAPPNTRAPSPVRRAGDFAAPATASPLPKRVREESEDSGRVVRRKFAEIPPMTGRPIKVVVGQSLGQQTFFIHEDLLIKHSEFFKAALEKKWEEGSESTVELPEDNSEHFKIFTGFLYTGQVHCPKEDDYTAAGPNETFARDLEWKRIYLSWRLGETLLSTSFKDACTDALMAKMRESGDNPGDPHINIYPHGAMHCGMKRLCVDVAVWKWSDAAMDNCKHSDGYGEFWYSVAAALHKTRFSGLQGTAPFTAPSTCSYHDHDKDGQCYKTMF